MKTSNELSTYEVQLKHMQITSGIADTPGKEHIDQKGKQQFIGRQSSGFISEMKEGEILDKMIDKTDPPYGLPEHGEGIRNNMIPSKIEPEMSVFETKEPQMSATKVAQPVATNIPLHADTQGNRHGHNSHLPSWKCHLMESERHMVVMENAN
ncbi:hypothetical protein L2E82_46939 [Cichorium intybus]|uniref:Uncharacterized protein n=1 Tax=Cichorium intybus TaxID=13427 RepID=A0ACB8YUQ0_CICIN|nr:hypothetical protein L2E82_46939 [Cichorium intybus]